MLAAHMDEISFLVKYYGRRGVHTSCDRLAAEKSARHGRPARRHHDGEWRDRARGIATRTHSAPGEGLSVPTHDEFFVDLGIAADAVKA